MYDEGKPLNKAYTKKVELAMKIVKEWAESGPKQMKHKDHKKLLSLLNSAPANLRLGNASLNSSIQQHMDYNPKETRSRNLYRIFIDGVDPHPPRNFTHLLPEGEETKPSFDITLPIVGKTSYYTQVE